MLTSDLLSAPDEYLCNESAAVGLLKPGVIACPAGAAGGPLDAPRSIAAGSFYRYEGGSAWNPYAFSMPSSIDREAL